MDPYKLTSKKKMKYISTTWLHEFIKENQLKYDVKSFKVDFDKRKIYFIFRDNSFGTRNF